MHMILHSTYISLVFNFLLHFFLNQLFAATVPFVLLERSQVIYEVICSVVNENSCICVMSYNKPQVVGVEDARREGGRMCCPLTVQVSRNLDNIFHIHIIVAHITKQNSMIPDNVICEHTPAVTACTNPPQV